MKKGSGLVLGGLKTKQKENWLNGESDESDAADGAAEDSVLKC